MTNNPLYSGKSCNDTALIDRNIQKRLKTRLTLVKKEHTVKDCGLDTWCGRLKSNPGDKQNSSLTAGLKYVPK